MPRRLRDMLQHAAISAKPTSRACTARRYGGGMGLVAACDIAIARAGPSSATSEVKLGIDSGRDLPYVIAAIGERAGAPLFSHGGALRRTRGARLGLVHEVADADVRSTRRSSEIVVALSAGGPKSQAAAKASSGVSQAVPITDELIEDTAQRIADIRARPKAAKASRAFLEKRKQPGFKRRAELNSVWKERHVHQNPDRQPWRNRLPRRRAPRAAWASAPSRCIRKPTPMRKHVRPATRRCCIGPAAAKESYLRGDKIIEAAQATGAQAIHPGLRLPVRERGLRRRLRRGRPGLHRPAGRGDPRHGLEVGRQAADGKGRACRWCRAITATTRTPDFLQRAGRRASAIRCCIKASAGGGGKGMRIVEQQRRFRGRAGVVQARSDQQLRRRQGAGREIPDAPAPHRDPGVRRHARQLRATCSSATARCSAATRKCWKKRRRPA